MRPGRPGWGGKEPYKDPSLYTDDQGYPLGMKKSTIRKYGRGSDTEESLDSDDSYANVGILIFWFDFELIFLFKVYRRNRAVDAPTTKNSKFFVFVVFGLLWIEIFHSCSCYMFVGVAVVFWLRRFYFQVSTHYAQTWMQKNGKF